MPPPIIPGQWRLTPATSPPIPPTPEDQADSADFDREMGALYDVLCATVFRYWDAHPESWRMDATLGALDLTLGFFEAYQAKMDAEIATGEADA